MPNNITDGNLLLNDGINSSQAAENPLYNAFARSGPNWNLILPATAVYLVAICGVCMNSFVIYVTVRTSTLRGSANYLMSLICLGEVFHQTGHSVFFVVTVSGINFIDLLTANLLMIPMLFWSNMLLALMLSAALDRLFAVAAPIQHRQICVNSKAKYLAAHTAVCACFALYSMYYTTKYSIEHPTIKTTGCISEILSGPVGSQYFLFTTILNSLCVLCYLLIWLIIKCKNGVSEKTNTRLLRSLIVIMLVSVGGYFINLSVYQIIFILTTNNIFDPIRLWQIAFIAGVLLNVGAASNAPILYLNSTEYRKAFKQHLRDIAETCHLRRGRTTTTSVVQIRPSQMKGTRSHSNAGTNY